MDFGRAGGRRVAADFDGGMVSSDAGALLLGETDKAIGLTDRFAACFGDGRSPLFTVHALKALVAQRVFGLALGYEDLNDHDELRRDPVLGVVLGKLTSDGDAPSPLAGKSTLNRLEHAPGQAKRARYHKISHDGPAIERLFVDLFLDAHAKAPRRIVLDLDATDDPLHGHRGRMLCIRLGKGGSSMVITTAIATCRSTSFAVAIFWPPGCAAPTSTPAPGRKRRWRASWNKSVSAGRM